MSKDISDKTAIIDFFNSVIEDEIQRKILKYFIEGGQQSNFLDWYISEIVNKENKE